MWEGGEMLSPLWMIAWDLEIEDLSALPFFLFFSFIMCYLVTRDN